ncbi:uncharacterized protein A1O5_02699 [Cladophialophora psammophila CBS 110553]|uniref:DEAD/DEAH box helicase n=1 Tax=Cladophialophora psammophila CBS 110553 TaxID=1182543 RepID=W9X2L3_9EURO|nr:uncharacterized protein A1O5_02699 [Cladophialophora psammophila CBS 110553]EXJ74403.1 hypothetical protein A1O5_02699 [Cladophialophora psammophila CBS 110553]
MVSFQDLLEWYDDLYSRTVDLVGDYAGDELFIIEGDSLLLHSFSDAKIDLSFGFQLLHATYIVENFLRALLQRKCKFHVVFFSRNARMCLPRDTTAHLRTRYLLAREAIIQHLSCNLPLTVPYVEVKVFDSYWSSDFEEYLASTGAYFFLCHDGSFPRSDKQDKDDDSPKDDDGDTSAPSELQASRDPISISRHGGGIIEKGSFKEPRLDYSRKVAMRSMIHWFIGHGYNIALITTVEYRDTKVMAMIVEGSRMRIRQLRQAQNNSSPISPKSESGSQCVFEPPFRDPPFRDPPFRDAACDLIENQETGSEIEDPVLNTKQNSNTKEAHFQTSQTEALAETLKILDRTSGSAPTQRVLLIVSTLSLMFRSGKIGSSFVLEACAMLLHVIVMQDCRLCDRAFDFECSATSMRFLTDFVDTARDILLSDPWRETVLRLKRPCDLGDLLDGRLFLNIASELQEPGAQHALGPSLLSSFRALASLLDDACGVNLQFESEIQKTRPQVTITMQNARFNATPLTSRIKGSIISTNGSGISTTVLPFNNSVFNAHLRPIQLAIDVSVSEEATSRIFKELSHWHNHRHPIDNKAISGMAEWQKARANRRNQLFMTETRDYAASLTNAVGGLLEPETVIVTSSRSRVQKAKADSVGTNGVSIKSKVQKTPAQGGKNQSLKPKVKDQAAAATLEKEKKDIAKQIEAWNSKRTEFAKERHLTSRVLMVKNYLKSLPTKKRVVVEAEVSTYLLSVLVEMWTKHCTSEDRVHSMAIMGLVWNQMLQIRKLDQGITAEIATYIANTVEAFRLPALESIPVQEQRSPHLKFVDLRSTNAGLDIQLSPLEFQLVHAGPFFDRDMGSAPDPRVRDFEPDKWQRDVLDQIDRKNSVFVVAPTSAGKTFISFYAMKQVLEEGDDGVLVYVAPTKALVNQIAAEVQARFSKSFKHPGKSVWAIYTRDHHVNSPTGCQVLVTVPHMLQIMLLAPSNANDWSSRVKRIIFDEIHCIGQADDGVVWEQLLLLAPCPIIALSATVGNPREFNAWLSKTQETNGIRLEMIEHRHRYSDLRKYVYNPPQKFLFNGLTVCLELPSVGIDNATGISFMHPVASLVDRSRGIPDDLTLEPRDCWTLWNAMKKHQTEAFPVDERLDPFKCLPPILRKVDIIEWEAKLKALLKVWVDDHKSPFEVVFTELEQSVRSAQRPDLQISSGKLNDSESPRLVRDADCFDTTLPLICSLHDEGALPALFFNFDGSACELIGKRLLRELQEAEARWKESSKAWKSKIDKWEAWKQNQEKQGRKKVPKKTKRSNANDEPTTRTERMREAGSEESSIYESFDPNDPVDGFHLADTQKLTPSEFQQCADELKARFVSDWLIDALKRGVGVHHAGMNRKYRQVCEILFRKGYLRVVIATGTLALGINMPCKTVVFSGDSIFLTALNFRQAAGRAGRRGFDVLGNVVFQGVSYSKVCRLLSSRLPDLNGHFPITTDLVLRLFNLLHESKHAAYAVKAINSILSCPRIYLGGPESKHTVLHHLRFSIEYLRRNHLLDASGAPLNFTGCVSHLYYTGNSSFAFHALLKSGYLSKLCEDILIRPRRVLLTLMLVMSHLFGRQYLRQSVLESRRAETRWSSSVVVLPPLPKQAASILLDHNDQTLDIYAAYVSTYIDQHVKEVDHNLPLTGMKCGGDKPLHEIGLSVAALPPVRINSAFVALSGHRDEWKTVSDLCKMVRSGVWLEEAVVPYVGTYPNESTALLNAYLYDFFKHGNVVALEKENGIRKGDIWFVLNDFSLVLATIVTSLENFLKLSLSTGNEMSDIMGCGDMHESELDDRVLEGDLGNKRAPNSRVLPSREMAKQDSASAKATSSLGKKKMADSWEEDMSDDMAETNGAVPEAIGEAIKAAKMEKKRHAIDKKKLQNAVKAESEVSEPGGDLSWKVLKTFTMLQAEFNQKFKAMWA